MAVCQKFITLAHTHTFSLPFFAHSGLKFLCDRMRREYIKEPILEGHLDNIRNIHVHVHMGYRIVVNINGSMVSGDNSQFSTSNIKSTCMYKLHSTITHTSTSACTSCTVPSHIQVPLHVHCVSYML